MWMDRQRSVGGPRKGFLERAYWALGEDRKAVLQEAEGLLRGLAIPHASPEYILSTCVDPGLSPPARRPIPSSLYADVIDPEDLLLEALHLPLSPPFSASAS